MEMRSEKLNLGHQDLLKARLKKMNIPLSEYSFANLYLFRQSHDYTVIFDREIFIRGRTYDGCSYLMPTVDVQRLDLSYLKSLVKTVDFLFPVPQQWLDVFVRAGFGHTYQDADSDYVYTVQKMATYSGSRLHKKRNLLNQFLSSYNHRAYPLVSGRIPDAINVLEEWQQQMPGSAKETDYYPCLEALKMNKRLVLCGGIYYVREEPAGFMLGEELANQMFVILFAKGKKKFKGIYQYMYNNFAKLLPEKYRYFNFEEDLGKEALKIAKSSYLPDALLKKFRVAIK